MTSGLSDLELAKREPIVNAALKEFARKGYDEASTNEIVREAGVSKGLLFHYFHSKKELFLFLVDYTLEIIQREFVDLINTEERDIFARYRQAALLKIDMIARHPYVFDFIGVAALTESAQVKDAIQSRTHTLLALSLSRFFDQMDTSRFRPGIDVKRAMRIITWTMEGYERAAQQELQAKTVSQLDYDAFLADFDAYIDVLKGCFYQ
jgi:AcrR family transcriptional regulator